MRTITKTLSTVVAATFVSGSLIGGAFAAFPDQTFGDANGNKPVSIEQMRISNAKALRASGKNVRILPFSGDYNGSGKEGFPRK